MSKTNTPLALKTPMAPPAGSSQSAGNPAANGAAHGASSMKTAAKSDTPASTSSSSSSSLGPGPRRFRGDVPAFNPSGLSPHLYTQQMLYAPQAPGLLPIYPVQQPQYFAQQPQFVPYGGGMMPYYPVAMGYPDYSMYQPYQYYALPAGQFPTPTAYMAMNGMNGMPGAATGYAPRKKNFKTHHTNHTYLNNHSSGHSHGGPHHPFKHSSASTHSLNGSTENGGSELRESEAHNSELAPRVDTSTSLTLSPHLLGSKELLTAHVETSEGKNQSLSLEEETDQAEKDGPLTVSQEGECSLEDKPKSAIEQGSRSQNEFPLFFNTTSTELIDSKHSALERGQTILRLKQARFAKLADANPNKNYHFDTKRTFRIIDHNTRSERGVKLGFGFLEEPKKAESPIVSQENESHDSNAPKAPLNWASLLLSTVKKTKKVKPDSPSNGSPASKPISTVPTAMPTLTDRYQSLGLLVMSLLYDPTFDLKSCELYKLKPRGLTNTGNICYMNAVLQCLLFCEPFNKVLRLVEEKSLGLLGKSSKTPILDATITFMNDFTNVAGKSSGVSINNDGIVVGRPLSPESLYMKLVESPKFQHLKWGQQEDAEEFLVYLLDGLHEDFVRAEAAVTVDQMEQLASLYGQKLDTVRAQDLKARMKHATRLVRHTDASASEDKDEPEDETFESGWSEVGGRRKVSSKRVSEVEPSPITSLFGGRFRSVLTVPKSKESHSITVDPFRCILLDISLEDVVTVEDALWKLNEAEKLPYKTEDGIEVTAQKQTYIEDLPEVLTLQLKRFSFQNGPEKSFEEGTEPKDNGISHFHGMGTIEKVLKNVGYGLDLTVPLESLSPASRKVQNRHYLLTGVIYHHGRNAEGGHYTCDVKRADEKWLRIDDTAVEAIDAGAVTEKPDSKDKSAYIFIYQRKRSTNA